MIDDIIRALKKERGVFDFGRDPSRLARRIAMDPFYRDVYARAGSISVLKEAGYIDDSGAGRAALSVIDARWPVTPLGKILRRIEELKRAGTRKPYLVLLSTGAFAPVHDGHVGMMEAARSRLEAEGYEVVGGFFAPAHDSYVATKDSFASQWPACRRIEALYSAVQGSKWLDVDPWMCRYARADLNFSDVLARLETYLARNAPCPRKIEVAYVFGADNAFFARAFASRGVAVCVNRPQCGKLLRQAAQEMPPSARVYFVRSGRNPSASRALRSVPHAPAAGAKNAAPYLVRDDLDWALVPWKGKGDSARLAQAKAAFLEGLQCALKEAFAQTTLEPAREMEIICLSVVKQKKILADLKKRHRILNIDAVTEPEGDCFGFSRLFDLAASQRQYIGAVTRGDAQRQEIRLQALKAGTYVAVDDDSVTGSCFRELARALPEGVNIAARLSLAEALFKKEFPDRPFDIWDIVDARDFLFGARLSGLVVRLFDGSIARAPYVLPYVSLASRAKIPSDCALAFSEKIVRLNLSFHKTLGVSLTLAEADPSFGALMESMGYSSSISLSKMLDAHLRMMSHARNINPDNETTKHGP